MIEDSRLPSIMPHIEKDCGPTEPVTTPAILPAGWKRLDTFSYRHRGGLCVIVSQAMERDGRHWLHVSVSHHDRLPTWEELTAVKEIFMGTTSLALQVFPPRNEWVNDCSNVLHLWCCIESRPVPDFRRRGTL